MNRFVLDCSVAMSWCFEDERNKFTDSVLERLMKEEAVVPSLWSLEVANVLLVAERTKRLTKAQSMRLLKLLNDLPIVAENTTTERAWGEILSLGRDYSLSSYDASYLEIAMREGLPLATQDSALKKAARKCGVPLVK